MVKCSKKTMRVDLHGLLRIDAECKLRNALDNLPAYIDTVEVIHGIGSGILKQMVAEFITAKSKTASSALATLVKLTFTSRSQHGHN